jgi:2-polyprenyl-3-methyl-5-hydroxy-6-metoxy-1,4-benzoquinol methylase
MVDLDFSRRAELEEQMEGPCSYEDLRDCLRDLSWVNRLTLAYRPTMEWLERAADAHLSTSSAPLRVVDVGCGYGDMLRRIERWAARREFAVELTGVDLNANAVRAAREATPAGSGIAWLAGDAYSCAKTAQADVVIASLVMHHLAEREVVRFLDWAESTAKVGWFINDLHRQAIPYYVFSVAMRGPWWHRFIRPDGMASIRRSFLREDWERICAAAGLGAAEVEIREYRPARLCVGRLR